MARSLTVKHEETASTNPLLTVFLLIAVGWMTLAAITGYAADRAAPAPATAPPAVHVP